jgi:hypothetical protein
MRGPSILLATVLGLSHTALAQSEPPSYGLDFVRVGAAGNAGYRPTGRGFPTGRLEEGAVAYEYRIARTEMTVGHWYEFVSAYSPFHTGSPIATAFTGDYVYWNGSGYEYPQEIARWPIQVGFEYAARYCNWLHNGKVNEAWAFENGAYDTSTFRTVDGVYQGQAAHNEGARFWIPTVDEWVKATYYDPNRFGEGQGGYWMYTNMSDERPIPGETTNAGEEFDITMPGDVGQFPNALSPWGLLDTSGGRREMTESAYDPGANTLYRVVRGSQVGSRLSFDEDLIVSESPMFATGSLAGFRIASSVPAPGTSMVVVLSAWASSLSRRRFHEESEQRVRGGGRASLGSAA